MGNSFLGHALIASLVCLLQVSTQIDSSSASTTFPVNQNIEYIKTSCSVTLYHRLCFNSLSIYASKIQANPKSLAHTALNVTLAATQRTSRMMKKLSRTHFLGAKEASAMADCIEVLGDSVDELQQSLQEMDHIRNSNFELTINDIQTWVSAALTDDDTCVDGFSGEDMNGDVKSVVRSYIVKVAHLTSNALALVNRYASTTDANDSLP